MMVSVSLIHYMYLTVARTLSYIHFTVWCILIQYFINNVIYNLLSKTNSHGTNNLVRI